VYLDPIAERMVPIGRIRERPDALAGPEEPFGDVATGVAETSGYDV
jgi:hypothetical protein